MLECTEDPEARQARMVDRQIQSELKRAKAASVSGGGVDAPYNAGFRRKLTSC
jgi:hypothetical protein